MFSRKIKLAGLLPATALALLIASAAAPTALAQRRVVFLRVQGRFQQRVQARRLPPGPGIAQERRMMDLPPRWADRLRNMSPQQQERFLSNNERFLSLPPGRQAQIRRQLQVWNRLAPEQRQAILERERVWQNMTPKQQSYVRNTLLPQWQSMAPPRRQLLLGKLHELRGLNDTDRASKMNDESFLAGLAPGERQMLRELSNLRVVGPEPPEPPGF